MATPGPSTSYYTQRAAGNILRIARAKRGLSQRQLAAAAGVAPSTVGRIEAGKVQPSLPTLAKVLAAVDLEMRIRVDDYDDHDDILDATTARLTPDQRVARDAALDDFLARLKAGRVEPQHV